MIVLPVVARYLALSYQGNKMANQAAELLTDGIETPSGKRAGDENFPVGSILIVRRLRPHVMRYYAFARAADDIADNPGLTADEKVQRLDAFEAGLAAFGRFWAPCSRRAARRGQHARSRRCIRTAWTGLLTARSRRCTSFDCGSFLGLGGPFQSDARTADRVLGIIQGDVVGYPIAGGRRD